MFNIPYGISLSVPFFVRYASSFSPKGTGNCLNTVLFCPLLSVLMFPHPSCLTPDQVWS
jgi:hypothetical protein